MRTMRSVVADTVGEPSEVLHLQTLPIPEPGPGQVRIRVAAIIFPMPAICIPSAADTDSPRTSPPYPESNPSV